MMWLVSWFSCVWQASKTLQLTWLVGFVKVTMYLNHIMTISWWVGIINRGPSLKTKSSHLKRNVQFNLQHVCSIIKRLKSTKKAKVSACFGNTTPVSGLLKPVGQPQRSKLWQNILLCDHNIGKYLTISSHSKLSIHWQLRTPSKCYLMQATAVAPSQYWDSASALQCGIGRHHKQHIQRVHYDRRPPKSSKCQPVSKFWHVRTFWWDLGFAM